jgi:hypothetical protein
MRLDDGSFVQAISLYTDKTFPFSYAVDESHDMCEG